MGPLTKTHIIPNTDITHVNINIQQYVRKTGYTGFIICDANGNIITNPNTRYIHQKFNGSDVFISAQSFQQNNKPLGNQIRKYVSQLISNLPELVCIGGESYLYGLTQSIPMIHAYTNSSHIYLDILYNFSFHKKQIRASGCLCDYNKVSKLVNTHTCLINLANLNAHLLRLVNMSNYNQIIIINCHHEDFWKKVKILSKYKIISRKQFVSNELGYFITCTVLTKN